VADLSRYDDVLALVREHAAATRAIRLAIVGGSRRRVVTTTLRLDRELWAEWDSAEPYDAIRDLLLGRFTTHHLWERPTDAWPDGGRQLCVHLQPDAATLREPTRILDVVVHPLTTDTVRIDPVATAPRSCSTTPTGLRLEHEDEAPHERALARGELAEATALHLRLAITPLVELLRIEHCPAR